MMSESMEFGATERGFALVEWTDRYDHRCSLQKSSLASDDCIWLGVNDAEPKILASVALRMGLPTNGETTGWVPYAVPEEVSMQTRMHLTRDMVRALLPLLQHFAETGEIPDKSTETAGLPQPSERERALDRRVEYIDNIARFLRDRLSQAAPGVAQIVKAAEDFEIAARNDAVGMGAGSGRMLDARRAAEDRLCDLYAKATTEVLADLALITSSASSFARGLRSGPAVPPTPAIEDASE